MAPSYVVSWLFWRHRDPDRAHPDFWPDNTDRCLTTPTKPPAVRRAHARSWSACSRSCAHARRRSYSACRWARSAYFRSGSPLGVPRTPTCRLAISGRCRRGAVAPPGRSMASLGSCSRGFRSDRDWGWSRYGRRRDPEIPGRALYRIQRTTNRALTAPPTSRWPLLDCRKMAPPIVHSYVRPVRKRTMKINPLPAIMKLINY